MKKDTLLVKGVRILRNKKLATVNLLLGEKILEISAQSAVPKADYEINARGLIALPGLIDVHVHFRDSGVSGGWEYREDWTSGSRAAAHGGITTAIDMPNSIPPTNTLKALEKKRQTASKNSLVNYGFFFGTGDAIEVKKVKNIAGIKMFLGDSTGNLGVQNNTETYFELAAKINKPLCVHAEDQACLKENEEKARMQGVTDHSLVRPPECALKATKHALQTALGKKNRLHVCHTTLAKELEEISSAKKSGGKITCEVTPHHLFLNQEDALRAENPNFFKVNPPLRNKHDQAALWHAIADGVIDLISSDHAPHSLREKQADYWQAPSGISGIETMLALLLNAVNEKKISLERVIELTSLNPAKVFRIKGKGLIEKGFDADLTLIDLRKEWRVHGDEFYSKAKFTPFEGRRLQGSVVSTIIGGKIVFSQNNFIDELGKEAVFG